MLLTVCGWSSASRTALGRGRESSCERTGLADRPTRSCRSSEVEGRRGDAIHVKLHV